jgi:hypothetical protein
MVVCSFVFPFAAVVCSSGVFVLEPDSDNSANPVVGKRELVGSVPAVLRYSGV